MQAEIVPYRLPLKQPWVAARTTLTERRGALLGLADAEGRIGWGDCAPLPSGGNADAVLAALAAYAYRPARTDFIAPPRSQNRLAAPHGGSVGLGRPGADFQHLPPEVRWAIETAQADLAAQRAGLPLWRHLGGARGEVEINAALGPLDDGLPARLAAARAQGFRIGKIKVGIVPVGEEIARLAALDAPLGLRLDANRAWNDEDAQRFLSAIADLPIDAVEEPLATPTPGKLAALQAGLPYALAIDESLSRLGLDALIAARAVRRFVLKPARLGGIAATQAIAAKARAVGIEVVITSVIDSAIGVTAAAHLAAALAPDLPHGLGTSAWLAMDVAVPPPITNGNLCLSKELGLGIQPANLLPHGLGFISPAPSLARFPSPQGRHPEA